jgi:hypothetical protein
MSLRIAIPVITLISLAFIAVDVASPSEAAAPPPALVQVQPDKAVSDQHVIDVAIAGYEQQQLADFLASLPKPVPLSTSRTSGTPSAPNYDPGDGSRWDQLAQCETGGNWSTNTGNGFGGGLQIMHGRGYSTWLSFGGGEFSPAPWEASREQQIVIAERVLASSGWRAWPGCSRKFGWI